MQQRKPYSIHFLILVFGQVISIVGNSIVSFSLTLYLLDTTGSATIFGIITAISAIPWAIAGPIGGILADKVSKKKIMVTLDFITAALIFAIAMTGLEYNVVLIIAVTKFLFSVIQSMYSPCVSSSLVYLVDREYLVKANSITSQVNSVSRIVGPILAGFLYGFLPIDLILYTGGTIFVVCAIIECFMVIPKTARSASVAHEKKDFTLAQSISFLAKENRHLFFFLCCVALAGLCVTPILTIGLPYIVNIYLNLPSHYYGISSAVAGVGTFIAGTIVFIVPKKFPFNSCGRLFIGSGVALIVMGTSLRFVSGIGAFVLLCVTILMLTVTTAIINILMYSFIQRITPPDMLGKIMSCVIILAGFADPIGQIIYGRLFDSASLSPFIITFASGMFVLIISVFASVFCRNAQSYETALNKQVYTSINSKTSPVIKQ